MSWKYPWSTSGCFLALGMACLSGCRHWDDPPERPILSVGEEARAAPAIGQQTADRKVTLGHSLEKQGQVDEAAAAYTEAVKRDPHRTDASWRLAVLKDQQGKWKESEKLYRLALKANPGNPDLYCDIGYSLYLQHRWPEAEMNFRQALALAPENRRAHINLGLVLARTDRVGEALVEFRTGKCDVADAHVNVAFALMLDHHFDEARKHYDRALALDSSCEAARTGLHELSLLAVRQRTGQSSGSTGNDLIQLTAGKNVPHEAGQGAIMLPPREANPEE